jgi:phage protein D
MLPRRSFLEIEIDGTDISEAVANCILDFTYTDRASGESDSIDLNVTDRDGLFIDAWYPMQNTGAETESGSSDYSEMAMALQRGCSAAELQRLIDASDLTPEQGAELYRVTERAKWPQYVAEHPQYRGESGKLTLIYDIKGAKPGTGQGQPGGGGGALSFRAKIHVENWDQDGDSGELDTGRFKIDSCSLSGPPDKFSIKAVSIPVTSSLKREEKTNKWEGATLQEIAKTIADNTGVQLMYEVESDIKFDRVDQLQQTDMSFLLDLCTQYGVSLKVTDEKMVLFEESVYEEKEPIDTFDKSEIGSRIIDYSFAQDTNGTVKKVELYYKDPKSGIVAQGRFTPPNPPATGEKLVLNDRPGDLRGDNFRKGVDNSTGSAGGNFDTGIHPFNDITADFNKPRADVTDNANRICKARCREKNKKEWTCTLKILGNVKMVGGVNINLTNWGKYSGKYMVDVATHKLGSYETTINAHRVLGY